MGIIAWKDMQVGQTVRFVRYEDGVDETWGWPFTVGNIYPVIKDDHGDTGPTDDDDTVPDKNYGFYFELVSDL